MSSPDLRLTMIRMVEEDTGILMYKRRCVKARIYREGSSFLPETLRFTTLPKDLTLHYPRSKRIVPIASFEDIYRNIEETHTSSKAPLRPLPGLSAQHDAHNIPKSIDRPLSFPAPAPGLLLSYYDAGSPPVAYRILQLRTCSKGTHFLLRGETDVWTGTTGAPMLYFDVTKNKDNVLMLRDFTCAYTKMRGVSWAYFFTLYNSAWKKYVSQEGEKVLIHQQDVLGRRDWESKDVDERNAARKRLEHEISIYEMLEEEKKNGAGCKWLAEYRGVVVDERSKQVDAIAYQGYLSDLRAYAKEYLLTCSGIQMIMQAVTKALTYLHGMGIAHGKIRAENVYLDYKVTVFTSLVRGDSKHVARFEEIVLGNFESAEDFAGRSVAEWASAMQQDWADLRLLEKWMKRVLTGHVDA